MLPAAIVIGHRVNRVTMEIGTADFPTRALGVRAQYECALCCSHQQKKISFSDTRVPHVVQDSGSRFVSVGVRSGGKDCSRLNGFEGSLDFTGALIALHGLFG